MNSNPPARARHLVLSVLATAALAVASVGDAHAQRVSLASLQAQITALQGRVTTLEGELAAARASVAALQGSSVLALDGILTYDDFEQTATFTGIDVQVVSGAPVGEINGRGNLIVGYNQPRSGQAVAVCSLGAFDNPTDCALEGGVFAADHKSGSHNLVVGEGNAYSAYGGVVVFGAQNAVTGDYSTVTGGGNNVA